jgi:RND family efflux transporter MFP subunit
MNKKILVSVLVIIVFVGGLYLAYSLGKKSAEQSTGEDTTEKTTVTSTTESVATPSPSSEETQTEQGKPVKVAPVEQRDINITQTFYGTVIPYAEANVQGKYGGKIVFLKGKEGDSVKKGEVIVQFDDSDTQLELQRAIAAKNAAIEQVNQAQSNFETIQADGERQKKLFEDGIVPKKTVDDANNQLKSAEATLNSARESVKQAEAQINLLENTLSDFKIGAPISGVIDVKQYNLNEVYRAGDVIYRIVDIDRVYINVEVPESYISQIREKMNVEVIFDSLEDQTFTGEIDLIVPTGEAQSRTFVAKALVKNPERKVKPGMFSRVTVSVENIPGALIVDPKALVKEGENYYVFKVVETQVKKIAVEVQYREETMVAVASDQLQPDDQVVVEGIDQLQPDDLVKIL